VLLGEFNGLSNTLDTLAERPNLMLCNCEFSKDDALELSVT
jgi:hypothetical protein